MSAVVTGNPHYVLVNVMLPMARDPQIKASSAYGSLSEASFQNREGSLGRIMSSSEPRERL